MLSSTTTRIVLVLAALSLLLGGCDDGESTVGDTSQTTDGAVDSGGGDSGPDGLSDAPGDGTSAPDAVQDMSNLWTMPALFSLVFDEELREMVHLQDASTISIPDVQISAQTLDRAPIPDQVVAVDSLDLNTRIQPAESTTGVDGLTDPVDLTLAGNMMLADALHELTPYFVGNAPDHLRNEVRVTTKGVSAELILPADANGDPMLPVADGGAATYSMTIDLQRMDLTDQTPLPANLEVGIEFITNQGTPPLAFTATTDTSMRWTVDPMNPTITVDLVATTTEAAQTRFHLQLYQLDGLRGSRLETLDVVTP